jgi:hypothetical protein
MEMHKGCCNRHHWFKGLVLLVLGVLFLLGTLGVIEFAFLTWWPLFPILMGVKMLLMPLFYRHDDKE